MSKLNGLNPNQESAASIIDGVIRVVAGPGTGKTKTTTSRIAHMLDKGIDPKSIVALTFTNKAADEMSDRIIASAGDDGRYVFAGTYHSFFIQRLLKPNQKHEYFKNFGYGDGFFILDDNDSDRLLQQCLKNTGPSLSILIDALEMDKKSISSWMGRQRAKGLTVEQSLDSIRQNKDAQKGFTMLRELASRAITSGLTAKDIQDPAKKICKTYPVTYDVLRAMVWKDYTKACVQAEGIDFDDVLVHANQMLRVDPSLAKRLSNQYKYFSLDEYQDTNPVQHEVIQQIAMANGTPNIFAVGDPRQSIYGFRAADVRLMTEMEKHYPNLNDVTLDTNYRSTPTLLKATNALAAVMNNQITSGQLNTPLKNKGGTPVIAMFNDDIEEAAWIVSQLKKKLDAGESLSSTAILYRTRTSRSSIENELLRLDLPFTIIGDVGFWERREVRDAMSIIRLSVRHQDDLALYRFVENSTLPVTPLTLRKNAIKENGIKPLQQLKQIAYSSSVGRKAIEVRKFINRYHAIRENIADCDPKQLTIQKLHEIILPDLLDINFYNALTGEEKEMVRLSSEQVKEMQISGFTPVLKAMYEDFIWPKQQELDRKQLEKKGASGEEISERLIQREKSVEQVFSLFEEHLRKGLSPAEALDELTLRAESSKENRQGSVSLLTNHASKGLEFESVYCIGAENENYIRDDEIGNDDTFDEECRNFYVAITRAEKSLTITYAEQRMINGEIRAQTPLQFLDPIIPHCHLQDNCKSNQDKLSLSDIQAKEVNTARSEQSTQPTETNQSAEQWYNQLLGKTPT